MDEPSIPLSEVQDLILALDEFWVYIEARKHIGSHLRDAHPDYIRLGDNLEKAKEKVKLRIEEWT